MPTLTYPKAPDILADEYARLSTNGTLESDIALFDFALRRAIVRDTATPANNLDGTPENVVTFTRASGGGRYNELGFYEWVISSDTIRYTHNPKTKSLSSSTCRVDHRTKALVTDGAYTYVAGTIVQITSASSTTKWMRGKVISYDAGTKVLVVKPSVVSNRGALASDWVVIQALGYLPEPQRTNTLTNSLMNTGGWSLANATRSTSTEISPDGTLNAITLTVSGTSFPRIAINSSLTAGTTYTRSFFVKAGSTPYLHGTIEVTGETTRFYLNLQTGVFSHNVTAGTNNILSDSLTYAGNGWWRYAITFTPATTASYSFFFGPSSSYPNSTGTLGDTINLWGAQEEVGAYPTSYIPTTSSSVTRAADVMSVVTSALPFSATEGTIIAVAQPYLDPGLSNAFIAGVSNSSGTERVHLRNRAIASGSINMAIVSGGVGGNIDSGNVNIGRFKAAGAYKVNDYQFVVNGSNIGQNTSVAMPSGLTRFDIGQGWSTINQYGAPIESVAYIPRRLSQAEMIARTS